MLKKEAIEAALAAHSQWKVRLLDAISNGTSEFKPDNVKKDNACAFGQWLYQLSAAEMESEDFKKIKVLHAEFHSVASEILNLALSGKKEEAQKKLEPGGGYGSISGKLVLALNSWKNKLQ